MTLLTPPEQAEALTIFAKLIAPEVAKLISHAEKRYLTVDEVANRLSAHPAVVRGHIKRGDLKAINIGSGEERRAVRISVESVKEFERRRAM